jgi:DNA-binding response OmpR family regulator
MPKARVLIVEDEPDIAGLIKLTFDLAGSDTTIVGSGDAAHRAVADGGPDLIVQDLNLSLPQPLESAQCSAAGHGAVG